MKLNKLKLSNVGLYHGKREFDLTINPTSHQPIILFGGLNGAGKTTIFDAIKHCLYGKEIFERTDIKKYEDYLINKIHRSEELIIQPNSASITLDFEYSKFGSINNYSVERSWELNKTRIVESLTIYENGKILDEVEQDDWQDFIKEIIPIGLSRLFFFDGEKIQKIMADNNSLEFSNSVKALLGIDLIEKLQTDLKTYKSKYLKDISTDKFRKSIELFGVTCDQLSKEISNEKDKLAKQNDLLQVIYTKRDAYKDKITAQGATFLTNKNNLSIDKKNLENEMELINEKLREIASGSLHLLICKELTQKLTKQIDQEENKKISDLTKSKITNQKSKFLNRVAKSNLWQESDFILNDQKKSIYNKSTAKEDFFERLRNMLSGEIDEIFELNKKDHIPEILKLSSAQSKKLTNTISNSLDIVPDNLKSFSSQFEKKFKKVESIVAEINKAPDEELIKPMFETLAKMDEEVIRISAEVKMIEAVLKSKQFNLQENERKREKLEAEEVKLQKDSLKLSYVIKSDKVLKKFKKRLAENKITILKKEFMTIFEKLHRKKDMIDHISIDHEQFRLQLYSKNNSIITTEQLSSGEKEIFAISLLYALAKTSGQNLPFVIDTPLGRLDSDHRDNLVEKFFPEASHQMLIFSTDTEIDSSYYDMLKPHISKSYNLNYMNEMKETEVEEGYFWN